jgi:hypothetical protein
VHESELTIPKGPDAPDERVAFIFELNYGPASVVDIETDQHDALAALIDELGHLTVGVVVDSMSSKPTSPTQ